METRLREIAETEGLARRTNGEAQPETERLVIPAPNLKMAKLTLNFTAPYVQNAFSGEAISTMRRGQEEGSTTKKGKLRKPKDFNALYEQSKHVSTEGWCGIPTGAFLGALVRACSLVGYKMTLAKLAIAILPDGFDRVDGQGLVKIVKGKPEKVEHAVPNDNGKPDIRCRAMWRECSVIVPMRYDADQFTLQDVVNLMARAGMQVGVGAGRPGSKNSTGCGWGMWAIEGVAEVKMK